MAHVVVHGHFYQPPRENPWSGTVPRQPSAAPFHDWNERITAECYRPNGWARIVADDGTVTAIVNNFEFLSFNLGPTLGAWLAEHAPDVLARMVEADARAGTALAQPYHHVILPLCNERDRRTELRWGRADFRHRFGRDPVGVWLPETAVDDATLATVADEGFGFTLLDPSQLDRPRPPGAYRWHDGADRSIDLVVYEGGVSHDIAFGLDRMTSAELVARAVRNVPGGSLVVVATDGETFGHHHKFTERAVAFALAVEVPRQGHTTGSIATWLGAHRPVEVAGVRPSAWSCAHGLGRWTRDCGCSTGGEPGWNQAWRTPLRAGLDLLRDHAAEVFAHVGAEVFHDPWAARDAYVEVLLDPSTWPEFAGRFLRAGAAPSHARHLLESQRHALAMYTSCGWFFSDPAGLETVLVLRHAACCLDELRAAGDDPPEAAVLDVLRAVRSNRPAEGDGCDLWARHVAPGRYESALDAALDAAEADLAAREQAWFDRHRDTVLSLAVAYGALPDGLALRVADVLGARIAQTLDRLGQPLDPAPLYEWLSLAHRLGVRPAEHRLAERAGQALARLTAAVIDATGPDSTAPGPGVTDVDRFLAAASSAGLAVPRDRAQEVVHDRLRAGQVYPSALRLGSILGLAVDRLVPSGPGG
jgi:hypothetical protein